MNDSPPEKQQRFRKIKCERCNAEFGCTLGGPCWCDEEPFKLPLPSEGSPPDCLCPSCLKACADELRTEMDLTE